MSGVGMDKQGMILSQGMGNARIGVLAVNYHLQHKDN